MESLSLRPVVCAVVLCAGIFCGSPAALVAQDRAVVGTAQEGSPYDRATGGVRLNRNSPVAVQKGVDKKGEIPKEKKDEFPKSGVLSSVMPQGYVRQGVATIAVPNFNSEDKPLIAGSVSARGSDSWVANVTNNGDETLGVTVAIEQLSGSGSVIKSDSYTFGGLKPGESVSRMASRNSSAMGARLVLVNRTTPKKRVAPPPPVDGVKAPSVKKK